jgi:hypothetical protein
MSTPEEVARNLICFLTGHDNPGKLSLDRTIATIKRERMHYVRMLEAVMRSGMILEIGLVGDRFTFHRKVCTITAIDKDSVSLREAIEAAYGSIKEGGRL